MSVRLLVCLGFGVVASGCVAPEEPPKPVRQAPAAATPSVPRANLEAAPVPNRRMRGPEDNTVRIVQ